MRLATGCGVAGVAAVVLISIATVVWAAPIDDLRHATDEVLRILKDRELSAPSRARERSAAIRRAIEPVFDLDEMARRALGLHWREGTPEERTEFVSLFRTLLERSYIDKIEAYSGERIVYLGESVDGDYATVRTKIITARDSDIPVDYEMLLRGGRWLVYDVRIEGVSLVEDYRVQFNAILDTSSFQALIQRIKARLETLGAE